MQGMCMSRRKRGYEKDPEEGFISPVTKIEEKYGKRLITLEKPS